MPDPKHPIQPVYEDEHGVCRFKPNKIVRHLLDQGGIDMDDIAMGDFTREDREQFAQLIGYSHSGAGDLEYVSSEVLDTALRMKGHSETEQDARIVVLQGQLKEIRTHLREAAVAAFEIHPDDLGDTDGNS